MKMITKIAAVILLFLYFMGSYGTAEELHLFTEEVPSAEEMSDIMFPELATGKKSGIKTRTIHFGSKKKASEPISIGMPINFALASYELQPEALPFLDQLGLMMNLEKLTNQKIVIEGHTDATGSKAYNKELSTKRADAVKDYLVKKYNIAAERLIISGQGETKILPGKSPSDGINRRVEFQRQH